MSDNSIDKSVYKKSLLGRDNLIRVVITKANDERRILLFNSSALLAFGITIVGGTDNVHIPGFNDFFISVVRQGSPADSTGKIKVGDRLVAVRLLVV